MAFTLAKIYNVDHTTRLPAVAAPAGNAFARSWLMKKQNVLAEWVSALPS